MWYVLIASPCTVIPCNALSPVQPANMQQITSRSNMLNCSTVEDSWQKGLIISYGICRSWSHSSKHLDLILWLVSQQVPVIWMGEADYIMVYGEGQGKFRYCEYFRSMIKIMYQVGEVPMLIIQQATGPVEGHSREKRLISTLWRICEKRLEGTGEGLKRHALADRTGGGTMERIKVGLD